MIDWTSLIIVAVVSVGATALFTLLLSLAIRLLAAGRADSDGVRTPAAAGGRLLLGLIGAMILFALYLIVPQFH